MLAAVSLLACLAACALWSVARRAGEERAAVSVYVDRAAARYTIRNEAGRLVLYAPPPSAPASLEDATARTRRHYVYRRELTSDEYDADDPIPRCTKLPAALAAEMRNADLVWEAWRIDNLFPWGRRDAVAHFSPRGRRGSATAQLAPNEVTRCASGWGEPPVRFPPYTLAQAARPLLAALEDPNRWVAAHVALASIGRSSRRAGTPLAYRPDPDTFSRIGSEEDQFLFSVDTLAVRLHGVGPERPWRCCSDGISGTIQTCVPSIDALEREAFIDRWHRRLDVSVASAGSGEIIALTVVTPAGWLLSRLLAQAQARRRRRAGGCHACGYDLRATPDRCPECGRAAGAMKSDAKTLSVATIGVERQS